MRQALRIGSRGSRLALWQAEFVRGLIQEKFSDIKVEVSIIRTTGDRILDSPLSVIGGKGVFVKEIEESLLRSDIDIAVHSMKDLPTFLPEGLTIGAVAKRHDPRDALVSNGNVKFSELPEGARVGTSSIRRQAQLLSLRPDLEIVPIRGNVDTRVRKLRTDGFDSIVLALAGLERMGLGNEITETFPVDAMIPAPGQGIIAIECRENDKETTRLLSKINHHDSWIAASAERAFLERLSGSCQVPAGCYAEVKEDKIKIISLVASPDGKTIIKEGIEGSSQNHGSIGKELAERVLQKGGSEILSALTF